MSLLRLLAVAWPVAVALAVSGAGAAPGQASPIPAEALRAYAEPLCADAKAKLGSTQFEKRFGSMPKCVSTMMGEVRRVMERCLKEASGDPQTCIIEALRALATRISAGGPTATDTVKPMVRAHAIGVIRPGETATILYGASDNSGTVNVRLRLFQGGTLVADLSRTLKGANLIYVKKEWPVGIGRNLIGPLFYCVGGEDKAGNRTSPYPNSKCAWLSLLVPIEGVSNGCGGESTWETVVKVQNWLADTHSYDDPTGTYSVDFRPACSIHDAGYGGFTVTDAIHGGKIVDFRAWSRPQVDRKFLDDMRLLCDRQIPEKAAAARRKCKASGGPLSFGAETLYDFVHEQGWRFFDADLTKPETQQRGHRRNW